MTQPINQMPPVLYWYAKVDEKGDITYHLIFEKEESDVTPKEADNAMDNASYLGYPVICIN